MAHVLVATLGDSPVVVTSMFNLLTQEKHLSIEYVLVIHPQGENRAFGYMVIDEALKGQCEIDSLELPFEDTYTEESCFIFLQRLFSLLLTYQSQDDSVYLSLAGGRKNMSALMALAAPFYPCVEGLYHVIDKSENTDRANFKTAAELIQLYNAGNHAQLVEMMHPDISGLCLVPIPLDNALRLKEDYAATFLEELATITPEQLQKRWEQSPEQIDEDLFLLDILKPPITQSMLKVKFTEQAKEDYANYGANLKHDFRLDFEYMRFVDLLLQHKPSQLRDPSHKKPYPCYLYKRGRTTERPFFHTEPGDILNQNSTVTTVIVERLTTHINETDYEPSVEKMLGTPYQQGQRLYELEEILGEKELIASVLIVPMGTQPMVATQLYTLLKERARRDIQEVVLLHTENSRVLWSVHKVMDAFKREKVKCRAEAVKGRNDAALQDIASQEDCQCYQDTLEDTIQQVQDRLLQEHSDARIDLALSGGRKGMAALTLFAAQRTQLREVYHTLIANKTLNDQIEREMERKRLEALKPREQNDKLFLRAYKAHKDDFRLFRVPIGPLHGR